VIDPRTLVPFDYTAVFESIDRTHHLVVAQEASFGGSWGGDGRGTIDAGPVRFLRRAASRRRRRRHAIPYASVLERAWVPSAQRIADGVRHVLDY
jgi:pyruvate dehydrogenase E1 component beta subunit